MSDIPEWAMQKARDLDGVGCGCHTDEEAANCDFFKCEEACRRPREAIARALMSTDREATERNTEVSRAADALLGTLWQLAYSGNCSFDENWSSMDRKFPQARWLHNALKGRPHDAAILNKGTHNV